MNSPSRSDDTADVSAAPSPNHAPRMRNLLTSLPDDIAARILSLVPRRVRRTVVLGLPELRGALAKQDARAVDTFDLLPFAGLDARAPAAPTHVADTGPRWLAVCGTALRALNLCAGVPAATTRVLLSAACTHCPRVERLAFADGGAVSGALFDTVCRTLGTLRHLTVGDPRDGVLSHLQALPATCRTLALVQMRMASLDGVLNGLTAFSAVAARRNSLSCLLHIMDSIRMLDGQASSAYYDQEADYLSNLKVRLANHGHEICAGLSALSLRHVTDDSHHTWSGMGSGWDRLFATHARGTDEFASAFPPYTRVSFNKSELFGVAPALNMHAIRRIVPNRHDPTGERAYKPDEAHGVEHTDGEDGEEDFSASVCSPPPIFAELSAFTSHVTYFDSVPRPPPGATGLRVKGTKGLYPTLEPKRKLVDACLREHCAGLRHVCVERIARHRTTWALKKEAVSQVAHVLRILPDLRALSLSQGLFRPSKSGRHTDISEILDACPALRVLHIFRAANADRDAQSVAGALPGLLRAVVNRAAHLSYVYLEASAPVELGPPPPPAVSYYPRPLPPPEVQHEPSCAFLLDMLIEASEVLDWAEWKRPDVDFSTVRSQVDAWQSQV